VSSRRLRRLAFLCLILALFQIISAIQVFLRAEAFAPLVALPPALDFVAGLLWGGAFALVAFQLWRGVWHARAGWLLGAGFAIYSILRLALFARADYDRGRLPFLSLLAGTFMIVTLVYALRSRSGNGDEKNDG
jgi:4-amino-4-deoxy-L-arabinose transferase-like glycosyltransferase